MRKILLLLALLLTTLMAGAQQAFRIPPEHQRGFASYIRVAPAFVDAVVLLANTNQTYTVPANADAVIFSSNCAAFYAIIGPTAAVPVANVTNGTASELNPSSWYVGRATQIGFISPTACTLTLAWYKLVIS